MLEGRRPRSRRSQDRPEVREPATLATLEPCWHGFIRSAATGALLLAGCRAAPSAPAIVGEPPQVVSSALALPVASASASAPLPASLAAPASSLPRISTPARATLALHTFELDDAVRGDCAVAPTGAVRCWSATAPPVAVAGLTGVDSLVATAHFTCARTKAGAVRCWGQDPFHDDRPKPGLFEAATADVRPGRVLGLGDDVEALSAGGQRICARRRGGALRCASEGAPKWVAPPSALAATQGGALDCWLGAAGSVTCDIGPGENDDRRLGRVSLAGTHSALALTGWGVHGDGAVELCVLDSAGAVRCYRGRGDLAHGVAQAISLPRPAVQLAAGMHHTCALLDDGSVQCWDGALGRHDVPGPVAGLPERAVEIAVGDRHACARLESGNVACFGGAYADGDAGGAAARVILGG